MTITCPEECCNCTSCVCIFTEGGRTTAEGNTQASEFMFTALMQIRGKQNPVSGMKSVGALSASLLNIWAWILSSLHQKLCHDICVFGSDGDVNGTELQKNSIICQIILQVAVHGGIKEKKEHLCLSHQ